MSDDKAPAPQVWPTMRCGDARAMIRFLVDVFGFEETVVYAEGARVDHAQLTWPEGGGIMLGSATGRGPDDPWALKPGGFGAYVVTAHVDAIHDRAVRAGVEIVRPITDTDYGNHEFAARDPEGNLWSFGTYRGEPRTTS